MDEISSAFETDAYAPIEAQTSDSNTGSLRYHIQNIPIPWIVDRQEDFFIVAISADGQIVENLSEDYISYDGNNNTLSISPIFGEKDFCVYVFRNEQAANNFSPKPDGNASIASILAQFEKDNRVLKQLQALQSRNLRSPDECGSVPNANFRKGKILSFDESGNPVCEKDLSGMLEAKDSAIEAAKNAQKFAEQAEQSAQNARDSSHSMLQTS